MNFLCTENFHNSVMDARLFPTVDHGTCEITSRKLNIICQELHHRGISGETSMIEVSTYPANAVKKSF